MGRTLLGAGHWNLKVMELEVGIPLPRGRYSISSMSQPSQKHHTTSPLLESLSFCFSVCTTVPQFNINKVIASHSTVSVEEASQTGSAMSVRSRLHAQLYEASCQMLQGPLPKKKRKKNELKYARPSCVMRQTFNSFMHLHSPFWSNMYHESQQHCWCQTGTLF